MATPPLLVEVRCRCGVRFWVLDSDHRGMGGDTEPYGKRFYRCPGCDAYKSACKVLRKSPPEFLMGLLAIDSRGASESDPWMRVLREQFPEHPVLEHLPPYRPTVRWWWPFGKG